MARAQERRHAPGRAHRRHGRLGPCGGRFRMVDCDPPPRCAQRPVRGRAEVGRSLRLPCRRRAARREVHRARRRLRGRRARHPEGGFALGRSAPAAPRAQAGLVGGDVTARARGAGRLAMASGTNATRARGQRADHGGRDVRPLALRSGARAAQPARHAGRPGAHHPQARGGDAAPARRDRRNHARAAPARSQCARRAGDHVGGAGRPDRRPGGGRARPSHHGSAPGSRSGQSRPCARPRRQHQKCRGCQGRGREARSGARCFSPSPGDRREACRRRPRQYRAATRLDDRPDQDRRDPRRHRQARRGARVVPSRGGHSGRPRRARARQAAVAGGSGGVIQPDRHGAGRQRRERGGAWPPISRA